MLNYRSLELGALSDVIKHEHGKVFLHDVLELTGMEVSINCVPKGFKVPFKHKHKENEELYIFLKGDGVLMIDDARVKVKEGTCVKILPAGSRTLENVGEDNLQYICIQTKENSLDEFGLGDAKLD
ncbi:MAG: cupin domain-containing protein [Opitutales bacterium]|nr:cupin domain-containing protein [Opitutales bacterium]